MRTTGLLAIAMLRLGTAHASCADFAFLPLIAGDPDGPLSAQLEIHGLPGGCRIEIVMADGSIETLQYAGAEPCVD